MKRLGIKTTYQMSWLDGGVYYLTLAIALALVLLRTNHNFWRSLPVLGNYSVYLHITNFSISYIFLTAGGILWLAILPRPQARRNLVIWAALLVLANYIMETYIRMLNTPDPLDAVAGVCGVSAGLVYLALLERRMTPVRGIRKPPL